MLLLRFLSTQSHGRAATLPKRAVCPFDCRLLVLFVLIHVLNFLFVTFSLFLTTSSGAMGPAQLKNMLSF